MQRKPFGLVVAAVVLVLVGCSSDNDDSIAKSPATTATASDPAKCREVGDALSKIARDAPGMDSATATATISQMEALFPDDLKDDFRTVVNSYTSPSSDDPKVQSAQKALSAYLMGICR